MSPTRSASTCPGESLPPTLIGGGIRVADDDMGKHKTLQRFPGTVRPRLIRYRMSDILRPVSAPQARRIVIQNLVGRTEQMPLFVNAAGAKDFISPHIINEIFVKGVTRFQMQITGASSFSFLICVEANLDEAERAIAAAGVRARLAEILAQKNLSNVTFEVRIVPDIPLNERTRKFQLIVNQIPD